MTTTTVMVTILAWVLIGLTAGLWLARRGHDVLWVLIAVVLGPLFVPIAWERAERRHRVAVSGGDERAVPAGSTGARVLVGLDGSPESERALDTALALLGPRMVSLVLAEVVVHEAADGGGGQLSGAGGATRRHAASRCPRIGGRPGGGRAPRPGCERAVAG